MTQYALRDEALGGLWKGSRRISACRGGRDGTSAAISRCGVTAIGTAL